MSTRAVIGWTRGDGDWRGVWNHSDGHTDLLGQALIERVAELHGDLDEVVRVIIDEVPGGWSNFAAGEKGQDGGTWTGAWSGDKAAFIGALPDAHYLYLFDLADRRLLVFEVDDGFCEPFTSCTFDANGHATPERLGSPFDDEGDDEDEDENEDEDEHEPSHSPEQVLAAAAKALGPRTFEAMANEDTDVVELYLVVQAADKPRSRDEIDVAELRRRGMEADDGDELLFPIYYRRDDIGPAHDQVQGGLTALLGLPSDTIETLQRALGTNAAN